MSKNSSSEKVVEAYIKRPGTAVAKGFRLSVKA
jgi:hypothetical protein